MTYPYKAILIDPFACTVTEVTVPGPDHTCIYPLLSHETMPVSAFEAARVVGLRGDDILFVDEEGLLKPCVRWFAIAGYEQVLAGKGLVLGTSARGDSVTPLTPLNTILNRVNFYELVGRAFIPTHTPWTRP